MALTQISTAGVKDDAVTAGKIPADAIGSSEIAANAVGSSELADNAVDTNAIANNAVTAGKLASGVQTTINNNADNRVITGSGTANTLNGESNLIFDGSSLGIRTTPSQPFHINQAGSSTTMRIENANADFLIQAGSAGNGGLHLYDFDNSAYRVMLDNSGRVGIGTASPAHKLHVEGSATGVISAKQTTNNGGFNIYEGDASDGTTKFYVTHNGRVGAADGIIFGTDTAAGNILNDYEEGTHNPTFANVDGGVVTTNSFNYTKVGRLVHINAKFTVGSNSDASTVGFSLPFTQAGSRENVFSAISTRSGTTKPAFAFVINANQSIAYAKELVGFGEDDCDYQDFAGDIILVTGTYESD